jgi:MFS family permease
VWSVRWTLRSNRAIIRVVALPGATISVRARAEDVSLRYAWYVVGVLTLVYVFSFIDRQIFSLLVSPLRRDLNITDTKVSLLMGFSFAVFYTCFGVPIGRLADSYNRRVVIAIGLLLWSAFTTACGLAETFSQMLILRMGVGVGEAALSPAAYSLITDFFPRERLATAISVYATGIYIGMGLSYMLGGVIVGWAEAEPDWTLPLVGVTHAWQLTFFIIGLPGIALVPLLFTIREPREWRARAAKSPMREVVGYILQNRRTFVLHNLGFALISLAAYATLGWVPEFYRRHFHWDIRTAGLVYGAIVSLGGIVGLIGAGRIADRVYARGHRAAVFIVASSIAALLVPVNLALFLAPSASWATAWLVAQSVLFAAPFGMAPTAIQQMMPRTMRGQASAVYLFFSALIGLGIGPTAVAVAAEYFFGGDRGLSFSLALVTSVGCAMSALLFWCARAPFLVSLDRLRAWSAPGA